MSSGGLRDQIARFPRHLSSSKTYVGRSRRYGLLRRSFFFRVSGDVVFLLQQREDDYSVWLDGTVVKGCWGCSVMDWLLRRYLEIVFPAGDHVYPGLKTELHSMRSTLESIYKDMRQCVSVSVAALSTQREQRVHSTLFYFCRAPSLC